MHSGISFGMKFLSYLQTGLNHSCVDPSSSSIVTEKKKAVKLASDMAMALARGGRRRWSRALISNLRKQQSSQSPSNAKFPLKKRNKLQLGRTKVRKWTCAPASVIAKRMIKKRTRVLQKLVPGGTSIDDFSTLIEEALDYLMALKAQAELMRHVILAIEISKCR